MVGKTQAVPSQQPAQLLVAQVPPQSSDSPAHLPAQLGVQTVVQLPPLQTFPALVQFSHWTPLKPQFASFGGATQFVPQQQPVQALVGQVPPQPSDAPAHAPAQLGVQTGVQLPAVQTCPWLAQFSQASPLEPQAVMVGGVTHVLPEQQPEQELLGQVPPQPSASPVHLSVQLGVQVLLQVPSVQVAEARQLVQASPPVPQNALSVPCLHSAPEQQPEQLAEEQAPELAQLPPRQTRSGSQPTQGAPPIPQAES